MTFEQFLDAELDGLRRFARVLTGDRETAHDTLAEALLRAQRHWRRIDAMAFPLAYVRRMVTTTYISQRRSWSSRWIRPVDPTVLADRRAHDGGVSGPRTAYGYHGPDGHAVDRVDDRAELHGLLAALPRQQRAAVVLRYYLDLSDPDIAAALSCSPNTVRSYISRGLAAMRVRAEVGQLDSAGEGGIVNTSDLRGALRGEADDAPPAAAIRATLTRRRQQRRRRLAVLAAAAAVVLIAGTIGILGSARSGRSSAPATPPWELGPTITAPAGSPLILFSTPYVYSPVALTVDRPADAVTTWATSSGVLWVSWGAVVRTYPTSGAPETHPEGFSAQRGYVITGAADSLPEATSTPTATSAVTVGGHAAILVEAATPPSNYVGVQADRWVSWQLGNGQYIHVWIAGADAPTLLAFAGQFAEQRTLLPPHLSIGLTLPGLPATYASHTSDPAFYGSIGLCPAGFVATADNMIPGSPCLEVEVLNLGYLSWLGRDGTTTLPESVVTLDGLEVHVLTGRQRAYAEVNDSFAVQVSAPAGSNLSTADFAVLVASVRIDPSIQRAAVTIE